MDYRQLRSDAEPDLLVHRAGQAVGTIPARRQRRLGAVHEQHAGPRSRNRQDRLVSPVHSRREPRHGRGVRERPDRLRRPQLAVQDGEARHPVGAGSQERQAARRARPRLSDAVQREPRDRRAPVAARHGSGVGHAAAVLSQPPRVQRLAGDGVLAGDARAVHSAQPGVRPRGVHGRGTERGASRRRHRPADARGASPQPRAQWRAPRHGHPQREGSLAQPDAHADAERGPGDRRRAGHRRRLGPEPLHPRRRDGEILFQTRLSSAVQGYPITYAVNDRQYIAVPVGAGSALFNMPKQIFPDRNPPPPGNALFVFALPERTGSVARTPPSGTRQFPVAGRVSESRRPRPDVERSSVRGEISRISGPGGQQ